MPSMNIQIEAGTEEEAFIPSIEGQVLNSENWDKLNAIHAELEKGKARQWRDQQDILEKFLN